MIYFTADTHFGHAGPLRSGWGARPFDSADEMNEAMIAAWNARVNRGDEVYVVGDFSFLRLEPTLAILRRLRGQKHLVIGNHDKQLVKKREFLGAWGSTSLIKTVKVADPAAPHGKRRVVLCHYAMRVWDQSHRGAWHLHGHSHGSLADDPHSLSMDVGVDTRDDLAPWSYDEIRDRMARKTFVPVDHHGATTPTEPAPG